MAKVDAQDRSEVFAHVCERAAGDWRVPACALGLVVGVDGCVATAAGDHDAVDRECCPERDE